MSLEYDTQDRGTPDFPPFDSPDMVEVEEKAEEDSGKGEGETPADAPADAPEDDGEDPVVKKKPGAKMKKPAASKPSKPGKAESSTPPPAQSKFKGKGKSKGSGNTPKGSAGKTPKSKSQAKSKADPKSKSKKSQMLENFEIQDDDDDMGDEKDASVGEAQDEDDGADAGRNRSKSQRFFHMLKAGSLPQGVLEQWSTTHGREKQTSLINDLFEKKGKNYVIKSDYATPKVYQANKSTERTDAAKDQQSGYGRMIFKKKYNLTDEDLDEAVRGGEVRCFKTGNVWLYAAVNVLVESGITKKNTENLSTELMDLGEEAGMAFANVFDQMVPEVNLENQNQSSSARPMLDPSASKTPLLAYILITFFLT